MTPAPWDGRYVVYRVYSVERLLYVGCTGSFESRITHHRLTQPWGMDIARVRVTIHRNKTAALAAEAEAIRTERPQWNIYGRGPRLTWGAQDYLDVLGSFAARDLAEAWNPRAAARRFNRILTELERRFPDTAHGFEQISPLPPDGIGYPMRISA